MWFWTCTWETDTKYIFPANCWTFFWPFAFSFKDFRTVPLCSLLNALWVESLWMFEALHNTIIQHKWHLFRLERCSVELRAFGTTGTTEWKVFWALPNRLCMMWARLAVILMGTLFFMSKCFYIATEYFQHEWDIKRFLLKVNFHNAFPQLFPVIYICISP